MRTLFVPTSTSWSFAPQATPTSWTLPASAKAGTVYMQASSSGSTPIVGQGVVFTVRFNGLVVYTSACMENGTDSFPVPINTPNIGVTSVLGCNGGPDPTSTSVWAVNT